MELLIKEEATKVETLRNLVDKVKGKANQSNKHNCNGTEKSSTSGNGKY